MSNYDRYPCVDISSSKKIFEFISIGPQGNIRKTIKFQKIASQNVYNLVFGNLNSDGSIDDLTINNNNDRDKILFTIAGTVFDFTQQYPDSYVFFRGSTKGRTRLYRMAITVNFEILSLTFDIWGFDNEGNIEPFHRSKDYDAFLVRRKKT